MVEKKASDLFFTSNAPIKIKIEGQIFPVNKQVLSPETVRQTALRAHDARAARVVPERVGDRLRDLRARPRPLPREHIHAARLSRRWCIRYITADMPKLESLGLPRVMSDLIMPSAA